MSIGELELSAIYKTHFLRCYYTKRLVHQKYLLNGLPLSYLT